jgi:hypothetical protein
MQGLQTMAHLANSTCMGVGLTMEGIFQNYAVYQYALDRYWTWCWWNALVLMCSQLMYQPCLHEFHQPGAQRVVSGRSAMVAHPIANHSLMLRLNAYARQRNGMPDGGAIIGAWTQLWVHLCVTCSKQVFLQTTLYGASQVSVVANPLFERPGLGRY